MTSEAEFFWGAFKLIVVEIVISDVVFANYGN